MKVQALRKVFLVAERQYRVDGRDDIAAALSKFASNLLNSDADETITGLVKRIEKARKPAKPRASKKNVGSGKKR